MSAVKLVNRIFLTAVVFAAVVFGEIVVEDERVQGKTNHPCVKRHVEHPTMKKDLIDAGYVLLDEGVIEQIHCQPEKFKFEENGFFQMYGVIEGERKRIIYFQTGQTLKPHFHDLYERFQVGGGSIEVSRYLAGMDEDPVKRVYARGDLFEVPTKVIHAVRALGDEPLIFHEMVDDETFQKRSTIFM